MIPKPFDIAGLRAGYRCGEFTPLDVATESLNRIAAYSDPAVWITRAAQTEVMARARSLATDPSLAERLPLYGVPFAVKDNIDCAGLPTSAACPAFAYEPERDAGVVARLLAAGAILMGKTNLDQFATGLVGTRSPYGAPRCVFDTRYVSGGSSSGSAVAVAAGLVAFSLGTDTAGSGRVPAAFNNIIGFKPTRGLIGMTGIVPACRSIDCVSVFAHTVGDALDVVHAAEGFEVEDPFSRALTRRELPLSDFRFGVLAAADREFFGDAEAAALYDAAIARLAALGGQAIEIDFAPFRAAAALLYGGPWVAERLAAIKDFFARHADEMDPSVRSIIGGGASRTAVEAFDGIYRLAALKHETGAQWASVDVLLLPTAPTIFTVEEAQADPIGRNSRLGLYTNFVNLLDYCAIAVPAGFRSDGLPFGVSLIAPAFCDGSLAGLADRLQQADSFGMGLARGAELPEPRPSVSGAGPDDQMALFVVGAHLTGMPLNHELRDLGAAFLSRARTAPDYRLFVLPNTTPPKPGLVRTPGQAAAGIEGELWSLSPDAFGRFVSRVPAPLGIGKVQLDDGTAVSGFLCEAYATENATDITAYGGWRKYWGTPN